MKVFAIALLFLAGGAWASDWRYSGNTGRGKDSAAMFFDTESVTRPSKDLARVWTKAINQTEIERYFKDHEKQIVHTVARQIGTYQIPRFLEIESVRTAYGADENKLTDAAMAIFTSEAVANSPEVNSSARLYLEFDCPGQRFRVLNTTLFNSGAVQSNRGTPNVPFEFIAPDTAAQWLARLVCERK